MGSRARIRTALLALAFGFSLGVGEARAEEPDASMRMAARELAVSGAEAFDKQDFATALDRFQRAESLYKVPSIAVMIARCYARLGLVVEAVDKYEETLRMPLDAAAPEAFQRAVAEATAEVEPVRARVARLELRLPAEVPAGLRVTLDQKTLPPALLGVPVPLNPGVHHLAARAPGRTPYSSDVTLSEGSHQSLELSLPESAKVDAPAASSSTEASASSKSHRVSTLSIALLAGGGVAIAVGAVTGISALNHKADLDEACKPGCPSSMSSDLDAFRTNRTLSYLGFGVGLAAAGAGTYFLLHEGSSGGQVGALVVPGGAALKGTF